MAERKPLWGAAARAFAEGRLEPLPRMPTVRPESDYEMDPGLTVLAEPAPLLAASLPLSPRDRFERAVRDAATYRSEDLGGEGTCGWLLSEAQFAAIGNAADRYAAALVEQCARPPEKQRGKR